MAISDMEAQYGGAWRVLVHHSRSQQRNRQRRATRPQGGMLGTAFAIMGALTNDPYRHASGLHIQQQDDLEATRKHFAQTKSTAATPGKQSEALLRLRIESGEYRLEDQPIQPPRNMNRFRGVVTNASIDGSPGDCLCGTVRLTAPYEDTFDYYVVFQNGAWHILMDGFEA
ncbi:MAG TPA: hypothetical protein VKX17_06055 [Planctomycetota bacterium]|nr:hypothetical protein [Planctomycetota bacterium]